MQIKKALLAVLLAVAPVMAEYTQKYNSTEVGYTVQDTIGSLFDALSQNASLIVIVVIGVFAVGGISIIFSKLKGMGTK
jgi:hypothetical protein